MVCVFNFDMKSVRSCQCVCVVEKRHRTLTELLFRRSPKDQKRLAGEGSRLEILAGNQGMRYVARRGEPPPPTNRESTKTRNAVFCAIVLEEFVKELAALTQEHAVLDDMEP